MRLMSGFRALAVVITLALAIGGCTSPGERDEAEAAGALAVSQAYVDAIAALDVETVNAMTDPAAFEHAAGPDEDIDIREALPDAVDPITDPWVALVGPTNEFRYGTAEYVIDVSYDVRGLTGGGNVVVRLDEDGDPSKIEDWTITEPLIVRGETYANDETFPVARIGPVELSFSSSHEGVWGYPGGYLLEPPTTIKRVKPLWVAVGAEDAAPWDDSLPMLEVPDQE